MAEAEKTLTAALKAIREKADFALKQLQEAEKERSIAVAMQKTDVSKTKAAAA